MLRADHNDRTTIFFGGRVRILLTAGIRAGRDKQWISFVSIQVISDVASLARGPTELIGFGQALLALSGSGNTLGK